MNDFDDYSMMDRAISKRHVLEGMQLSTTTTTTTTTTSSSSSSSCSGSPLTSREETARTNGKMIINSSKPRARNNINSANNHHHHSNSSASSARVNSTLAQLQEILSDHEVDVVSTLSPTSGNALAVPAPPLAATNHATANTPRRRPSYMMPTAQEQIRQQEKQEEINARNAKMNEEKEKARRKGPGLTSTDLFLSEQRDRELQLQQRLEREEQERALARQALLAKQGINVDFTNNVKSPTHALSPHAPSHARRASIKIINQNNEDNNNNNNNLTSSSYTTTTSSTSYDSSSSSSSSSFSTATTQHNSNTSSTSSNIPMTHLSDADTKDSDFHLLSAPTSNHEHKKKLSDIYEPNNAKQMSGFELLLESTRFKQQNQKKKVKQSVDNIEKTFGRMTAAQLERTADTLEKKNQLDEQKREREAKMREKERERERDRELNNNNNNRHERDPVSMPNLSDKHYKQEKKSTFFPNLWKRMFS